MRTNAWITLFWSLGAASLACYTDRPVVVVTSPDAAEPSTPGAAGTTGGTPGAGGAGGATGIAGSTGAGGIVMQGCADIARVISEHTCALAGACHDASGSGGNLSLDLPFNDYQGWRNRLVGQRPKGGGNSACGGVDLPYLIAGSSPAAGLLLNKLRNRTPVCGDQMPSLPPTLSVAELDCVQRWANALTASAPEPTCPLSCTTYEYCQFSLRGDGGPDGTWACRPRPTCAGGVLSCACIQQVPGCSYCEQRTDYFRCGGI